MNCRVTHQKKLVEGLKAKQSVKEIETLLNGWWTQEGCAESFQKHRDTMRQSWRSRMQEFEKGLSAEQRQSLVEELTSFKDNIRGILK